MVFADVGDWLTAEPGDAIVVRGPFAHGVPMDGRNLIVRALSVAGERRAVTLDKRLPHPGGVGGGSSDAAAVLRLVGAALPTADLMSLGADLPVCLLARAARMRGVGEDVTAVALPTLHAVLVHPGIAVPTPAVFAAHAGSWGAGHGDMPEFADAAAATGWMARQRNDLEVAAIGLAPPISEALDALRGAGADLARMSGSGATCFGLWPSRAAADAAAARLAHPGWWVRSCSLS